MAMSKDVNSLFNFIDGAKDAQKTGNKTDPLSQLTSYYAAIDYEKKLETIIWETRGSSGVRMFKQLRKQAAEKERKGRYAQIARRNKIMNILSIIIGLSLFAGGIFGIFWFAVTFSR